PRFSCSLRPAQLYRTFSRLCTTFAVSRLALPSRLVATDSPSRPVRVPPTGFEPDQESGRDTFATCTDPRFRAQSTPSKCEQLTCTDSSAWKPRLRTASATPGLEARLPQLRPSASARTLPP